MNNTTKIIEIPHLDAYFGNLFLKKERDRFYWAMDGGCYEEEYTEIPESLYNEIIKIKDGYERN